MEAAGPQIVAGRGHFEALLSDKEEDCGGRPSSSCDGQLSSQSAGDAASHVGITAVRRALTEVLLEVTGEHWNASQPVQLTRQIIIEQYFAWVWRQASAHAGEFLEATAASAIASASAAGLGRPASKAERKAVAKRERQAARRVRGEVSVGAWPTWCAGVYIWCVLPLVCPRVHPRVRPAVRLL
jgi:hypothetical protein